MTDKTPPLPDSTLGYIAGVIDAIGRLRARETTGALLPEVSVSSPRLDMLTFLAQRTGVRVVEVRRDYARFGCDEHCDQRHLHVHSHTGRWQVSGYRATIVLANLLPHLQRHRLDAGQLITLGLAAGHKASVGRSMIALGWEDIARLDAAWR